MSRCIMQIGDWIAVQDVNKNLTSTEYLLFRKYLQDCGYSVNPNLGQQNFYSEYDNYSIILDPSGNLLWGTPDRFRFNKLGGKQITVSDIRKVIAEKSGITQLAERIQDLEQRRDKINAELNDAKQELLCRLEF